MIEVVRIDEDSDSKKKGGRPFGSTDKTLKLRDDAVIATKNEIAVLFSNAKEKSGKKILRKGTLSGMIKEVTGCNGLPNDCVSKGLYQTAC